MPNNFYVKSLHAVVAAILNLSSLPGHRKVIKVLEGKGL